MKQSKRLQEIFRKNREYEKKSPYNFCDRWCQRCSHEKQISCILYKDELECKITCIAHGKDEDDPEITEAVMEAQYKELEDKLPGERSDKFGIDLDNPGIDEDDLDEEDAVNFEDLPLEVQKHIRSVENNPLPVTAKQYHKKAHNFLKDTFYEKKVEQGFVYDFETVAWYHTLLSVKLQRALAGFHESFSEGDIALYDAVAQFEICRKAVQESIRALINLKNRYLSYDLQISELLALLHNILSRVELMEGEI